MRVIVIGGGAVGLCAAEALSARDCEVTVLERGRCGDAASAGNAGWVTPSLATPVPGPGVIAASLRWLVDPTGPLWIQPTLSPEFLRWIAGFMLCCRRPVYRRGLVAMQRLTALAAGAYDTLAARGVEFEQHEDPLLYPCFERAELEHVWRVVEELQQVGSDQRCDRASADELRALEPALGADLVGGVIAYGERRVRPEGLTGMRSLSPDGLPFIGLVPGLDGVHVAAAHATLGITLAPVTGELLAGGLLDGARGELLSAFDPARVLTFRRVIARAARVSGAWSSGPA